MCTFFRKCCIISLKSSRNVIKLSFLKNLCFKTNIYKIMYLYKRATRKKSICFSQILVKHTTDSKRYIGNLTSASILAAITTPPK